MIKQTEVSESGEAVEKDIDRYEMESDLTGCTAEICGKLILAQLYFSWPMLSGLCGRVCKFATDTARWPHP